MLQIVEAIPTLRLQDKKAQLILVISNPEWQEGTKQFLYDLNENCTLTLISSS